MKPYYEHAGITIYHGDCRDVMASLKADALVTDPPYGVNLGSHGGATDGRKDHVLVKGPYATYIDSPENFLSVVVSAALAIVDRGAVFCAGHMAFELPRPAAIGGVFLPAATGRCAWGYKRPDADYSAAMKSTKKSRPTFSIGKMRSLVMVNWSWPLGVHFDHCVFASSCPVPYTG